MVISSMKLARIISLISLIFISSALKAQSFEGQINYKINYLELPANVKGMESMLPQVLEMSIKGNQIAMKQELMGGTQTILSNGETEESVILMDMMGQKIAIMMTKEEAKKAREELGEPEFSYLDGTKEIAGFKCSKAIMKTGDQEIELWYTKDIAGAVHKDFADLDGFPLEYLTYSQGMKLSIVAETVLIGEQEDTNFTVPEGYNKMSMTEFSQLMGQGN